MEENLRFLAAVYDLPRRYLKQRIDRALSQLGHPGPRSTADQRLGPDRGKYRPATHADAPALIGVILHLTMVLFTPIAIVRERERGNLELLITTPVKSWELWVSQWLFDVPVRGQVLDLYLASVFFILAALALGLTVSTLAKTQFQAIQLTVFTFLPSILLPGFMFPFEGMPLAAQWIGEVIPLTHFVRLSRGILVRGAELSELHAEIWPLLAFFVVFMVIATLRFSKRLD
nr:ABC transporter permease [uncultured Marinobacter sp.]